MTATRWTAQDLARLNGRIQGEMKAPTLAVNPATPTLHQRRNRKYGNRPEQIDGITFDSRLEARRYGELKLLQSAGAIEKLRVHSQWFLHVNNQELGYYESDFDYMEHGQLVVEDAKGIETTLYRWKKKHLLFEYGITIREIKA